MYISRKNILRCFVIMESMQNTINRNQNFTNVSLLKKRWYLCKLYNWHMILLTFGYDLLKCPKCGKSMCAFEVYYKKLHYLNNIERSWDMAEAMLIIVSQSSNNAEYPNKNLHNQSHCETSLRSFVMSFFHQSLYTIFYDLRNFL